MAMNGDTLAKDIADAMKDADLFNIRNAEGDYVFDQESYDKALINLKIMYNVLVAHLQDNMEVTTSLEVGFDSVIGSGVPVIQDGGVALQTSQRVFIGTQPTVDTAKSTKVE